jgi:hypothetical protein
MAREDSTVRCQTEAIDAVLKADAVQLRLQPWYRCAPGLLQGDNVRLALSERGNLIAEALDPAVDVP